VKNQLILDLHRELIVDNFAGGGGASTGIEMALGRSPDIAINHDPEALALHKANHPQTAHYPEDVFAINPLEVTYGRPVGLAWFSPDCKHHSKAKGGKPRNKKIRGLAWVAVKWAAIAQPRVIILENVEEFQDWGPLLLNHMPDPKKKGRFFRGFVTRLRGLGYQVECKLLRACDYGAPTIRRRLFLIARRDGRPIVWPSPTHGDPKKPATRRARLKPWKTAAECIDFSLPCHSIFLTKEEGRAVGVKRPLAEKTMARIAKGTWKFVIEAKEPFIVTCNHGGDHFRGQGLTRPFNTILGAHDAHGLIVPQLAPFLTEHANGSGQRVMPADEPLRTQCAEVKGGHFALVTAFLAKHYSGVIGTPIDRPASTVTSVDHHSLVTSHLMRLKGTCRHGQDLREPLRNIEASGNHYAEVRAFLMKYYGCGDGAPLDEPMHTVTALDRLALVTITGVDYAIVDIGMRMLEPQELYNAQGFPKSYQINIDITDKFGVSKRLSKKAQVRMCGNSVCPPLAALLVGLNVPEMAVSKKEKSMELA